MPTALPWKPLCQAMSAADADLVLQCLKKTTITKSHTMPCTVCLTATPHTMRYQRLSCVCKQCKLAAPYASCPWTSKILTCQDNGLVSMWEFGDHVAAAIHPREPDITPEMKAFAIARAQEDLSPKRILDAMVRALCLTAGQLPPLKKIQNLVGNYRRRAMRGTDSQAIITEIVRGAAYSGNESVHDPFTFTWSYDNDGYPVTGNGSDSHPFLVGVTTKYLLRQAARDPATFAMHVDGTYKLSYLDYTVYVVGISDARRNVHLLALFLTSHEHASQLVSIFSALRWIFQQVIESPLQVQCVMGNADNAQFNALSQVFGEDSPFRFLMCFYHVMAKMREKTRNLSDRLTAAVMANIYDLHFRFSENEFQDRKSQVLTRWRVTEGLEMFAPYCEGQWITGRFSGWQCYLSPLGFAATNNPVEQFNWVIKQRFTQHRKLRTGLLLQRIMNACRSELMAPRTFSMVTGGFKRFQRRATELRRRGFLVEVPENKGSLAFLLGDRPSGIVTVRAQQPPRVLLPAGKGSKEDVAVTAQLGYHTARMEVEGQPVEGWQVDISEKKCPCRFFQKYGECVHLTFALWTKMLTNDAGEDSLLSRRVRSRRSIPGHGPITGGRPHRLGRALDRD